MNSKTVSILIPTYNDFSGVHDTLQSLAQQTYPLDKWEVIVIDNNSTDDTVKRLEESQSAFPFKLKVLIEKDIQSSYAARNKGLATANGDIIALIDADMTVNSDWIERGVNSIITQNADYVGCPVHIYPRSLSPNMWELYNQRTGFQIEKYMRLYGFAGGGNLFVKKKVFEQVGNFDTGLVSGGDMEFGNRVRDAGLIMYFDDENIMYHPARQSRHSIWKKNVRTASGQIDLHNRYPKRYGKLTFKNVLTAFRPIVKLERFMSTKGLTIIERLKMYIACYVVWFASIYGRMRRYSQIKFSQNS